MAELSTRNRRFLRRQQAAERPVPRRALTAAASPMDLTSKTEARRLRVLRQGWQLDAASYVDNIPELSFAYRFLSNASSRMRYFPALVNPDEPDGPPVPVADVPNVPPGLVDCMNEAMRALGVGRQALSPIQTSLSYQFGVPGECFLTGMTRDDGQAEWKIRSIDEFMVFDDIYKLREVPLDPQGQLGWTDLAPATTYAARMWVPHWRFSMMATSPMRSLLDVSEELLLLSRDVRATARSRLAGGGILKFPEGLRLESMVEDDDDPEGENIFGRFTEAMMSPLADEGVASAVVPMVISGEPEALAGLEHLLIDRPYSALAIELRAEAIGRLATGLDVPREVLEGMSDPNHWGAWLVSDDTFRHHIEPQVIAQVDALTVGYLRAWLKAAGQPQYWIDRACIWYDPTDLISKPDPMANAIQLWDRDVLSNGALLKAGGFADADKPDPLETEIRMLLKLRAFPPNVVEALIHALDPNLLIPPINQSGQIPGMGPKGAVDPVVPVKPGAPGALPSGPGEGTGPTPGATGAPEAEGSAAGPLPTAPAAPGMRAPLVPMSPEVETFAAAQAPKPRATYDRESRHLAALDAQLRARVQTAACAMMLRFLDRAGAKIQTRLGSRKYNRNDQLTASAHGVPNRMLANHVGDAVVASLGFGSAHALIDADWSELRDQFTAWVEAAQHQALRAAGKIAGYSDGDAPMIQAAHRMAQSIEPAWASLEAELNAIAERLLYDPSPTGPKDLTIDPNTVVPTGTIRRALAIAGGAKPRGLTAAGEDDGDTGQPNVDVSQPIDQINDPPASTVSVAVGDLDTSGQIGTGAAVSDMLSDSPDVSGVSFEWIHGPTMRPFEPHEALDGVSFSNFDDDVLANAEDWPEVDYYFPGDHPGCSCDFATIWGEADTTTTDAGPTGDGATTPDEESTFGALGRALSQFDWGSFDNTLDAQDAFEDEYGADGKKLTRAISHYAAAGEPTDAEMSILAEAAEGADPTDETLFRTIGLRKDDPVGLDTFTGLRPGDSLPRRNSFDSYTTDSAHAEKFGKLKGDAGMVRIELQPGARALDIDGPTSGRENERLVAQELRVVKADVTTSDSGYTEVNLTVQAVEPADASALAAPTTVLTPADEEALVNSTGSSYLSQAVQEFLQGSDAELGEADLKAAKAEVMDEIRTNADDANSVLDSMGVRTLQRPPARTLDEAGRAVSGKGGEWDWYYQLQDAERDRLRNNGWIVDDPTKSGPDEVVRAYSDAAGAHDPTVDQAMAYWLEQTRMVDGGTLLQSTGRLPGNLSRFGDFNWSNLAPHTDVAQLFNPQKDLAVQFLNGTNREQAYELASRELKATEGLPIYQMTYTDYEAELERVSAEMDRIDAIPQDAEWGQALSAADQATVARYSELVPQVLTDGMTDETPLYEVWLEAQYIAKLAGLAG